MERAQRRHGVLPAVGELDANQRRSSSALSSSSPVGPAAWPASRLATFSPAASARRASRSIGCRSSAPCPRSAAARRCAGCWSQTTAESAAAPRRHGTDARPATAPSTRPTVRWHQSRPWSGWFPTRRRRPGPPHGPARGLPGAILRAAIPRIDEMHLPRLVGHGGHHRAIATPRCPAATSRRTGPGAGAAARAAGRDARWPWRPRPPSRMVCSA